MVSQLCECTKNHWIVHCKWVNFMVCKLYLNKAVKNQQKETHTHTHTIEHPIDILCVLMYNGDQGLVDGQLYSTVKFCEISKITWIS